MRAKIVRIGNSRGIRLPKTLIEQTGLTEEVELDVQEGKIVLSPVRDLRRGWAEAARILAERGEDRLLDEHLPTHFDEEEWEW